MAIQIRKAERRKARLRVGMSGPSGSGKTYSGLLVARGMASAWDKVLLIDSENGSGELYSDLGGYNVITLQAPFSPEKYTEAIKAAEDAGMEVIVIDSVSHEWDGKGGCLEINEKLASAKFKGNTWAAWSETTPRHQKFIESITQSSCHIITTSRSKTDMIQTEDKKIKKVGMKEIQREGFEYELTVNFNIDRDGHLAIASKDRTQLFIERDPFLLTEKTGEELLKWNEGGKENPDLDPTIAKKKKIMARLQVLHLPTKTIAEIESGVKQITGLDLLPENFDEISNRLEVIISERKETGTLDKKPEPEQNLKQTPPTVIANGFVEEPEPEFRTREEVDGSIWKIYKDGSKEQIKKSRAELAKQEQDATDQQGLEFPTQ